MSTWFVCFQLEEQLGRLLNLNQRKPLNIILYLWLWSLHTLNMYQNKHSQHVYKTPGIRNWVIYEWLYAHYFNQISILTITIEFVSNLNIQSSRRTFPFKRKGDRYFHYRVNWWIYGLPPVQPTKYHSTMKAFTDNLKTCSLYERKK